MDIVDELNGTSQYSEIGIPYCIISVNEMTKTASFGESKTFNGQSISPALRYIQYTSPKILSIKETVTKGQCSPPRV
jgi:hypothetical protein